MKNVDGKIAFITGGASGMGLGMAKIFAKYGMKIVMADIRQSALDEAMAYFNEQGQKALPIQLDVTDRDAYARAADEAEKKFGKIHVLVNNAGVGTGGPLSQMTYKDWDFGMGVNLNGVINGIVTILPRILQHGEEGHVVSTSSTGGFSAVPFVGIYCTAKYAIAGMMESLAGELEDTNVGVSVYFPGPVKTHLRQSTDEIRSEVLKEEKKDSPPPPESNKRPAFDNSQFMDPLDVGEYVLRGIRRNDLFIMSHPEFRDGIIARNEALLRALPDEPLNEQRYESLKAFGPLLHNKIYDKQTTPGPPDWK